MSAQRIRWYVNDVQGGNESVGLISANGEYTAPASPPADSPVLVKGVSQGSGSAIAGVKILYETQTGTPLRKSSENSRYFENAGGAVYLTGGHTWYSVQDRSNSDPPYAVEFKRYLNLLKSRNHNFTRLWAWQLPKDRCGESISYTDPFPWSRTGSGVASDGKPKFDLSRFNPEYFERLRSRVQMAQENGIFVSVMLFEGYELLHCGDSDDGFPFYLQNNVNGVDASRGKATWIRTESFRNLQAFPFYYKRSYCEHDWLTGRNPQVLEIQKRYVSKVVETLNGFDNVLWEISNESGAKSMAWQEGWVEFLREREADLPKKHPIGLTFPWGRGCTGSTQTLFDSDADWISPGLDLGDYRGLETGPAANDGKKVIVSDNDHLGIVDSLWVWKSFLRGLNVIFMDDPWDLAGFRTKFGDRIQTQKAMGRALSIARQLPLGSIVPSTTACSTGFSLVASGTHYVCLAPAGGSFTVDLSAAARAEFSVEWLDIDGRGIASPVTQVSGGDQRVLSCPSGDQPCIVLIKLMNGTNRRSSTRP